MRCCFVYKEDYPWDVRVEKIIVSLLNHGNPVVLCCRNLEGRSRAERMGDLEIWRLPGAKRWPRLVAKVINVPLWFNPFWLLAIYRSVRLVDADVIIVRDLPLVLSALLIARLTRCRVVFDMAECYPEMYRSSLQFAGHSALKWIAKNPWLAASYERLAIKHADHTLVMIEESRDRLVRLGAKPDQITIVSNTPPLSKLVGSRPTDSGTLRLIYVGFLTRLRGLDVLVKAFHHALDRGKIPNNSRLDIIGVGAAKSELDQLVMNLGMSGSVFIHGWLSHAEVSELMDAANVGVLPYRVCGHWHHTIPNKLFDYMAAGLPVLATRVNPIERIITECKCGIVCNDDDPVDLARGMAHLASSSTRAEFGANGHEAVRSKYNWSVDERRLLHVIQGL